MNEMNKKAVSPLIATVLLMVLVVVVGTIILTYVRTYTQDSLDKTDELTANQQACGIEANIDFVEVNGYKQVCYDWDPASGDMLYKVMIENKGSIDLTGFRARLIGNSGYIHTEEFNTAVAQGGAQLAKNDSLNVSGALTTDTITKLEITPKIKPLGQTTDFYCNDLTLEIEDILNCTEVGLV